VQLGLRVDRDAARADLEMQVAADRVNIAGRADAADPLAGADAVAPPQPRGVLEVRVPVVAVRARTRAVDA
jgi:hypothetical protein